MVRTENHRVLQLEQKTIYDIHGLLPIPVKGVVSAVMVTVVVICTHSIPMKYPKYNLQQMLFWYQAFMLSLKVCKSNCIHSNGPMPTGGTAMPMQCKIA